MPELPDITIYTERLQALAGGQLLRRLRLLNPFVLRTALPPITQAESGRLSAVERLGKRIVLVLDRPGGGALLLALHLMVAGRLRWLLSGAKLPSRGALGAFEFESGTLLMTEAGTQRRASLHLLPDRAALAAIDPGGIDVFAINGAAFAARLRQGNHTLKRALTDPRLFSGIATRTRTRSCTARGCHRWR